MPIRVVCECGKQMKVKDELAGKKIKCPACQAPLTIPQPDDVEEEEAPLKPKTGKAKAPPKIVAEAPADDDEALRKDKKKKAEKGGSKAMLFVGIGAGALLLFCCCGIGIGAWFWFGTSAPDKTMVGKWKVDIEETKKIAPKFDAKGLDAQETYEITADGRFLVNSKVDTKTVLLEATYKVTKVEKDMVTVEVRFKDDPENQPQTGQIKVISRSRIRFMEGKLGPTLVLKRF